MLLLTLLIKQKTTNGKRLIASKSVATHSPIASYFYTNSWFFYGDQVSWQTNFTTKNLPEWRGQEINCANQRIRFWDLPQQSLRQTTRPALVLWCWYSGRESPDQRSCELNGFVPHQRLRPQSDNRYCRPGRTSGSGKCRQDSV